MAEPDQPGRTPLFGPLPVEGIWTTVGLSRLQFAAILLTSLVVFLFTGGPVWAHLRGPRPSDFPRIALSYGLIVPLVMVSLQRNRKLKFSLVLAASGVLALVKLLVTAGIEVLLGIGFSGVRG
jgi:hypothetical protein